MTTNRAVDAVFDNLIFRKAYHFAGGILVTGLLIAVHNGRLLLFLGLLYLTVFWVWGKRVSFAVLGLLLLAAVSNSRFICAGAYLAFTIGDGAAAVLGSRFGRKTWPWHHTKTVVGTVAFLLMSFPALALFISRTSLSSSVEILLLAALPASVGAAVESAPITAIRDRKADDNLLVVLSIGLVLHVLVQVLSVSATI